jgi:glycosyltransferase involved in cell wall biosynthesis
MARICLLTPGHLATNPRLVKEADALLDAGHDVTVIAAEFALWAREADRIFAGRSWRVGRTLRFGPHAALSSRVIQLLRQRGARVMMGLGARNQTVLRAAWHPIAPDLVSAAKDIEANLYVAHYPAALPAAAIAARTHNALFAFDAEDFHLGDYPVGPAHEVERRMLRAIEARYLPNCSYVTAASPGIADAYVEAHGIARPTVVLNVFPRAHAPAAATSRGSANSGPSIYWFSQTIGPDRGLECAVRAIGRAKSRPYLYLRGTPAKGFLDRLRNLALDAGVADRLHLLPPASPSEMVRLAAVYDIGLSGEPGHTPNNRIALGNKLFSYLLAGLPIVASAVPSHMAIAEKLGATMRLYPINDPDGLADAIDSYLCVPRALSDARAAAWRLGMERFNWDVEKASLLDRIASICGASDRAMLNEAADYNL